MSSERNRVSPYCSREGSQAVRSGDSGAGKGGEKKRTPPGNRADTDPVSGAKASPLLSGLSSREILTNRGKDAKQMKAEQSAGAASDVSGHWREVDWRTVTERFAGSRCVS